MTSDFCQEPNIRVEPIINFKKEQPYNVYVLTLEGSIRYKKIEDHLIKNKINFNKVYGVNGKECSKELYQSESLGYLSILSSRPVIGCGLSHIKIWKYIIDNKSNKINLVIEDDTCVDFYNLDILIEQLDQMSQADNVGYIQLVGVGIGNEGEIELNDTHKVVHFTRQWSTGSYLISKKSAIVMYKSVKLSYHIDAHLNSYKDVFINFIIQPCIADQDGWEISTIATSQNKLFTKLNNATIYAINIPLLRVPYLCLVFNYTIFIVCAIIFVCIVLKVEPIVYIFVGFLFLELLTFDFH